MSKPQKVRQKIPNEKVKENEIKGTGSQQNHSLRALEQRKGRKERNNKTLRSRLLTVISRK